MALRYPERVASGSNPETPTRRPTLEMVAKEAGVTRSTVSRVINAERDVSAATVELVNQAIERLGYVPNRAARSLASSRSMAVALIVPERAEWFLDDPHLVALMAGASRRLEQSEYVLTLIAGSPDPQGKTMRYLSSGAVDGGLIASHHDQHSYLQTLHRSMPVVFGGRPAAGNEEGSHFVDVDNAAAARLAAEHLLSLGRSRIGMITGPEDMRSVVDRYDGWRAAVAEAGLPVDAVEHADFTGAGAVRATRRLLERAPDLDGLFVANDIMANAAITVLQQSGRAVPADVAVVGFDNSTAATVGPVPLTTIDQPSIDMGWRMADALLRILAGEEVPTGITLPTELVVRDSA